MTKENEEDVKALKRTLELETEWAVYVCQTKDCFSLSPVPTFVVAQGILKSEAPPEIKCTKCNGVMKLKRK